MCRVPICVSSDYSPHQHIQPAHVDNTRHLHLTAVPIHFSGPLWRIVQVRFILFPQTASSPPLFRDRSQVFQMRERLVISPWVPGPPSAATPFNSHQLAPVKHWSGWERLREVDSTWMRERNSWKRSPFSARKNGFSFHNLREANWAVMRGTSPLSLTAGNSITSHANWLGLSFLGGNPGNS